MSERLANKCALITGGSMGMGAAHVREFIAEGAKVLIADIADEQGQELAQSLGENAHYVHLDVTKFDQWQQAVKIAEERFGALNVLVNNAGIFNTGTLADYALEDWDRTIAINLTGSFLGMKAALSALAKSAPSSIVNISSTAGMTAYPGFHAYGASKWGLRGLTRSAALELAAQRIRVNSVHPGSIATPLIEKFRKLEQSDFEGSSLTRFAKPEEVSKLVVYLASDESSFSTGAEFVVDGGITAGYPVG